MYLEPRDHLKTTTISIGSTLWMLARDINTSHLIFCATDAQGIKIKSPIVNHCTHNAKLRRLWPHLKIENAILNNENNLQFLRPNLSLKEPSVTVMGIDKAVESVHYTRVLYDDLTGLKNMLTHSMREKTFRQYEATEELVRSEFPIRIMVGTRWHKEDVPGKLFIHEIFDWDVRTCELFYRVNERGEKETITDNDIVEILQKYQATGDARKALGNIYVPYSRVMTPEVIMRKVKKAPKNFYKYFCQHHNKTTSSTTQAFKPEWFLPAVVSIQEKDIPFPRDLMYFYICYDLASGSRDRNASKVGRAVWSVDCNKMVYLWEVFEGFLRQDEVAEMIFEDDWNYKPQYFTSESGTLINQLEQYLELALKVKKEALLKSENEVDRMRGQQIKMPNFDKITKNTADRAKLPRIIAGLQGLYQTGRIKHVGDPEKFKPLINQLTNIEEMERHIDLADAAADISFCMNYAPNRESVESTMARRSYNEPNIDPVSKQAWANVKKILNDSAPVVQDACVFIEEGMW